LFLAFFIIIEPKITRALQKEARPFWKFPFSESEMKGKDSYLFFQSLRFFLFRFSSKSFFKKTFFFSFYCYKTEKREIFYNDKKDSLEKKIFVKNKNNIFAAKLYAIKFFEN